MLLAGSCTNKDASFSTSPEFTKVRILENEKTDYRLEWSIQILKDTISGYSIQDILKPNLQNRFQPYIEYTLPVENYQYYWGKLQVENRLTDANQFAEWVLSFTNTWSKLDIYLEEQDGSWRREQSGTFTPDHSKSFVPTAKGNLVKLTLPPHEVVTIYFHGISERTAIYPSFYTRLKHIETFYSNLLKTKVANAIFLGFLLMMLFYNLIVYFFGKDRSFIFYSGYLIMVVVYATYSSEDLVDWFGLFPDHPVYQHFTKLSLYLGMMFYLAFIRGFLDLSQLLPKWDTVFKVIIYLGFPLIVLDVVVLWRTNFSYVVEDWITVPFIFIVIVVLCALLYPLYRTRDKKGWFVIGGITAISLGAFLTIISRIWIPPFSIFYLKAGIIIEVIIFSLGLGYRQRQQKQAQQLADFKLKESQLMQEKKELEANRFKELNAFKSRFYTNITHEFRTPLTVIMGITNNINKHEKEKELILRNSQNLLQLINQLLDLSKLDSGTLTLNKVHQDIIVYLQYLIESFYSAAAQRNIRLLFHSEEEKLMMDYDEEKMQQVIYNLLSNSLKFTGEYGKILVHTSKIEQEGSPVLKLKVKDTGIGIPAENIDYIFDRFYQIDPFGNPKEESTGIGLALTRELVELMKGRIEVQSMVGKGTEFIIYLPVETQLAETEKRPVERKGVQQDLSNLDFINPSKSQPEVYNAIKSSPPAFLPELLIIEDNQDIVTYIESILGDKYLIHTARNGTLGIEKALDVIPDIIISDVMMPEKSGYEVCKVLKQDERTSHIPIILLTAKSTQLDKVHGLKYGADAYLVKPFDKEELTIRLEKLVETHHRLQQYYAHTVGNSQNTEPSVDDIFLLKLREHIQAYLNNAEFGVAQLASAAGMSQMQIYRKLKALTGKTPSQFIRSYRLQKGVELLKKGSLNISQVAYETGFTDPSYFSRVFQQEFGKSPSDFFK